MVKLKAAVITAIGLALIGLVYALGLVNIGVPVYIAGVGGVLILVGSALYLKEVL